MREPDPDILVDLTTARTAFEAEAIANALEARGIPAKAFTTAGSMLQWDIAGTQPMRIQVRRRNLEQARAALHDARQDSVDLDWSEVDTGDPTPEGPDELDRRADERACAGCGFDLRGSRQAARCPECGRYLTGEPVAPTRAVRPRVAAAIGCVLMAVVVAATMPPLVGIAAVGVATLAVMLLLSQV